MGRGDQFDFEWAFEAATLQTLEGSLPLLDGARREPMPDPPLPDEQMIALLESAGMQFDQQQRQHAAADSNVVVSGKTDIDTMVDSLLKAVAEQSSGALVVDTSLDPVRITEVRGVNSRVLVHVNGEGGQQLQPDPDVLFAALDEALGD